MRLYPAAAFAAALAWLAAHAPAVDEEAGGDGEALAVGDGMVAGDPEEGEEGDSDNEGMVFDDL